MHRDAIATIRMRNDRGSDQGGHGEVMGNERIVGCIWKLGINRIS